MTRTLWWIAGAGLLGALYFAAQYSLTSWAITRTHQTNGGEGRGDKGGKGEGAYLP